MLWTSLSVFLVVSFFAFPAGAQSPTTTSDEPDSATDRDSDDNANPKGEADDGPAMGGLIIAILFVAIVALLFVGFLRYRHH